MDLNFNFGGGRALLQGVDSLFNDYEGGSTLPDFDYNRELQYLLASISALPVNCRRSIYGMLKQA